MTIQMHKKVKITVLRTEYDQELAEQYAIPNLGKCPFHQKGQVLYSDGINPPDGMCGVCLLYTSLLSFPTVNAEHITGIGININAVSVWIVFCKYCSHRIESPRCV